MQDPNEVKTKFSKQIETTFFQVGDDIKAVFVNWITYLREEKLFGFSDPVFPQTKIGHDQNMAFKPQGIGRTCWSTASPIRTIFKNAFERAGMSYYSPHTFRHMLVKIGEERCTTPEQFKAWSQNLGHEKVLTTFTSYGHVPSHRQGDLMQHLTKNTSADNRPVTMRDLENLLGHK